MRSIMTAGNKGGSGKSSIAHHIAVRAAERDFRVLVIDTDRQADLYRRLVTDEGNTADCPPAEWEAGCVVSYSPDAYDIPTAADFDLMVIDTAPSRELPEGPAPDLIVVPIDGVDAARNANETVAEARDRKVPVLIVFNGIGEGGKRHARQFDRVRESLPDGVDALVEEIPRTGAIKRTAVTCEPAWRDIWKGRDVQRLRQVCDDLLDLVMAEDGAESVA